MAAHLQLLFAWWNLVYLVPLALALIYLILYMITGISFGDGDADTDTDADTDADGDASVDTDADASIDHDLEHDVAHDAGHDHDASHNALGLLTFVGLGKVPLSMVLVILFLLWGTLGLVLNRLLAPILPAPWLALLLSAPVAALASIAAAGAIARLMARYLPTTETYATSKESLVGRTGETLYNVDQTFGMVQLRDSTGDLHQLPCRTAPAKPPIPKDTRVVLFDYDAQKGVFYVAPFQTERPSTMTEDESAPRPDTPAREPLPRDLPVTPEPPTPDPEPGTPLRKELQ